MLCRGISLAAKRVEPHSWLLQSSNEPATPLQPCSLLRCSEPMNSPQNVKCHLAMSSSDSL